MECSHTVEVIEQCRVSPPPGSLSLSPLSFPLTFFDLQRLFAHSVHRLFFYEFHDSKTHFLNAIVPNLKHSLSLTLQHFFPLAGSFAWPDSSDKPVIICTDVDSVCFTVAESQHDFHHLSGNHPRDVNLFHPLVPELFSTSDAKTFPALALQVTLFPDKGICIGVHYNHGVADGKIMVHFIKSWASVSRTHDASLITAEPQLCYDRSLVKDPDGEGLFSLELFNRTRESFDISNQHVFPVQDKVLATFLMRPCDVKKIKQWVMTHFQNENAPLQLSTFVITCAYVWVCLVKARLSMRKEIPNASDDPVMFEYFGFAMDCRAQQKPPLPPLYFGNCLGGGIVKASASELTGEDGVAIASMLIANAVQKGRDGDGEDKSKKMETFGSNEFRSALGRGGVLGVAGSPKFGEYDADFGWGRPRKTEMSSIAGTGTMNLSEIPGEVGGVEVSLARSKMEMDAFSFLFADNLQTFPDCSD